MANARKTSIHHQVMMRRASRSEYNDGLLRNNQRHENRLVLELEQWEKAQRTVAKGLEKESHWFKQNASASGPNAQRSMKKNSLTELGGDAGQSRLIPDYQYRSRNRNSVVAAQIGIVENPDQDQYDQHSANVRENGIERKSTDQTDSSKSHKKHSKSSDSDGKKSGSKHSEEKKSHRKSHKHGGERESRDRESEKRDSDKTASRGDSSLAVERKTSRTAVGEISTMSTKQNHSPQSAASDKTTTHSKTSTKTAKKHLATDDVALPTTTTATTTPNTTSTPTTTNATTATNTTTADETKSESKPSKTSSSARAFSQVDDVHDPGDVLVTPRQLNDLGWDGRRRYTNVWDSLSAPKRASQVRSVRSRLQREFTQIPSSSDVPSSSSKGLAGTRKSGQTPSLF